ncbi:Clavaminate synthase-like protein [Neofusicoccum parvum]|nr:Clavaminate synthase-like protein [Neofusicoccum parvum]
MSPEALKSECSTSFEVKLLPRTEEQKFNFGVTISGLDLNTISDDDVSALKTAIWTHKLVVIKHQHSLTPPNHWSLVTRLDPSAPALHSHGSPSTFQSKGGVLSKNRPVVGIPGAENVRLIGKGHQGPDHHGLKDLTLKALSHDFHALELPDAEFENGCTRFQRWHLDAPLYERDPAWFTTLRAVRLPRGPDVRIRWDDGSGLEMASRPGLTAFLSNVQLYSMLSEEEKEMADCSWVEYAPWPYKWIENCKGNANGLGLVTEGKENRLEELGEYDEAKIKKYPMVWVNPVTGEKAFQVHGICARKLYIRRSTTEIAEVIDDVVKIRAFLSNIQSRILKPEYICLPEIEEGDIIMWDNYNMFHSAVDYPLKYGPRTMHQANIGASRGPVGPVLIPSIA